MLINMSSKIISFIVLSAHWKAFIFQYSNLSFIMVISP